MAMVTFAHGKAVPTMFKRRGHPLRPEVEAVVRHAVRAGWTVSGESDRLSRFAVRFNWEHPSAAPLERPWDPPYMDLMALGGIGAARLVQDGSAWLYELWQDNGTYAFPFASGPDAIGLALETGCDLPMPTAAFLEQLIANGYLVFYWTSRWMRGWRGELAIIPGNAPPPSQRDLPFDAGFTWLGHDSFVLIRRCTIPPVERV